MAICQRRILSYKPTTRYTMAEQMDDPLTTLLGFSFSMAWKCLLLALILAAITFVAVPRSWLVMTARNDRMVQKIESFPVNLLPWGLYAAGAEQPPAEDMQLVRESNERRDFAGKAMDRSYSLMGRFVPSMKAKWSAYWSIIGPRLLVAAGFLPAFLALCWMMWHMGYSKFTERHRDGERIEPHKFRWSMVGWGVSVMVFFAYPVAPITLPALFLLLPIAGGMVGMYFLRSYKA